jgi:lipopolysaccharide export system permease protein
MKLTDKYILGKFLKILGFSLAAFILVVIIVDLVENIDRFIDHKTPVKLVISYYLHYIPFIIVLALPVATLLSTMFTIGSLAKYHELEVMKATGISLYRLIVPLLVAGLLISIMLIIFSDLVVVPANYKKDQIKKMEIEKKKTSGGALRANIIKAGQNGWVVFARTYNEQEDKGDFVVINKIENNQVKTAIKAETMIWADSGWILTNATRRAFEKDHEVEFVAYDTLYAGFLSHTPGIMKHKLKKARDTRFFELLNIIKLKKLMGQDTAKDKVELYLKISFPFINFIIIILGIPLAANPRRSGGTIGFGLSIIISFIYFVILRAGQSFGYNDKLPPALAATIGNIIFLMVGLTMFFKTRK